MNDLFWRMFAMFLALLGAVVVACLFSHQVPPEMLAVFMGLLFTVAHLMMPFMTNAKSTFKTSVPPPPTPPPPPPPVDTIPSPPPDMQEPPHE